MTDVRFVDGPLHGEVREVEDLPEALLVLVTSPLRFTVEDRAAGDELPDDLTVRFRAESTSWFVRYVLEPAGLSSPEPWLYVFDTPVDPDSFR